MLSNEKLVDSIYWETYRGFDFPLLPSTALSTVSYVQIKPPKRDYMVQMVWDYKGWITDDFQSAIEKKCKKVPTCLVCKEKNMIDLPWKAFVASVFLQLRLRLLNERKDQVESIYDFTLFYFDDVAANDYRVLRKLKNRGRVTLKLKGILQKDGRYDLIVLDENLDGLSIRDRKNETAIRRSQGHSFHMSDFMNVTLQLDKPYMSQTLECLRLQTRLFKNWGGRWTDKPRKLGE